MDSGQAPRACTRVWIGVDLGVPVRKLTLHHVARVAREGIPYTIGDIDGVVDGSGYNKYVFQ